MAGFFGKLFGTKQGGNYDERRNDDDYAIKKSRRTDVIIAIISLICAIILWIYVVSSGSMTIS